MVLIHPSAILLTSLIVGLMAMAILALSGTTSPQVRHGVALWVAGDAVFSLGRLTLLLQPGVASGAGLAMLGPDVAGMLHAALVIAGALLHAIALRAAFRNRANGPVLLAAPALAALGYLGLAVWLPRNELRIQLMLLCTIACMVWTLQIAWPQRRKFRGAWLICNMMVFVLCCALVFLVVVGLAPAGRTGSELLPPLPIVLLDLASALVMTMAFLLTQFERMQQIAGRLAQSLSDTLEALRELNGELEDRVAARTVDLERARLDSEAASRAKSEFVATMSHEIRTPMNGVIGMIDVMKLTPLDDEQTRMLTLARESADALMTIIDDILDFSKIEAGEIGLECEPLSIVDVIKRSVAVVTGMARDKSVRLATEIDPDLPPALLGDAVRLRQILVNLLGNAIKFSSGRPHARLTLSATLIATDSDLATLDLCVEDNGIGMDEAALARLYRPFTQADPSTTRRFGGTGLGLAVTKRFVELMGGTIDARSTPDVGSVFTVRLQLRNASTATPQGRFPSTGHNDAVTVARPAAKPRRPELFLVAEDNEMNQAVVILQLRMLGFDAEVAANGVEALELWRTGRFAIVLTDLQMPEMDGYGLTAAIRGEEERGQRIPIVALTANALKDEERKCKAAGMDDYLTKPAPIALLEATFNRLLPREDPTTRRLRRSRETEAWQT